MREYICEKKKLTNYNMKEEKEGKSVGEKVWGEESHFTYL